MSSTTTSFGGNFPRYTGIQINGLADTESASTVEGDMLAWNATTLKWENRFTRASTTVVTTDSSAAAASYNADEMVGGLIIRDPSGGDRTDTTSSAALLVAATPGAIVGSSFKFVVRNAADAAETITLGAGSGVTLSGTMTVAQNNSREFLVVYNNVTTGSEAVTVYSLGTSVH